MCNSYVLGSSYVSRQLLDIVGIKRTMSIERDQALEFLEEETRDSQFLGSLLCNHILLSIKLSYFYYISMFGIGFYQVSVCIKYSSNVTRIGGKKHSTLAFE